MCRNLPGGVAGAVLLAAAASAFAQPPAGGPFGPGFGMMNPVANVKTQIGATDEEWKVIGPKIQKVSAARQVLAADARGPNTGFGFPFGGGFPGPGGPGGGFSGPGFPGPGFGGPGFGVPPAGPPGAPPASKDAPPKGDEPAAGPTPAKPAAPANDPKAGAAPGPVGAPIANNVISQARLDLKAVLDDPKHTAADVQARIEAVRKARQKAVADLEAAQKDLRQLVTADQEAVLISLGYLD